jgi:hypothetical protein
MFIFTESHHILEHPIATLIAVLVGVVAALVIARAMK